MRKIVFIFLVILAAQHAAAQWGTQASGTSYSLYAICATDAGTAYAAGSGGTLLKTTNGGSSWATLSCSATAWLQGVYFINASVGFAVGDNGTILKTTNGGSWLPKTSGTGQSLNGVCFTDANTGYACGSSGTILKSTDGGNTWFRQTTDSDRWFLSISFAGTTNGFSAGYWGQISGTTNGGGPAVGVEDPPVARGSLRISPNPASSLITVNSASAGSLVISDLNGRQMITCKVPGPGTSIDISALPAGIYIVKLTGDEGIQIAKFIRK